MICAACGQPVTDEERHEAIVWLDPDARSCVAHDACLVVYDEILAGAELGEV